VIGEISKVYGIELPFIRPDYLSSDDATTNDVLLHALAFYESKGINYDVVVLLQHNISIKKIRPD
jgi:N-acylneuraminate cytidylyltransferase